MGGQRCRGFGWKGEVKSVCQSRGIFEEETAVLEEREVSANADRQDDLALCGVGGAAEPAADAMISAMLASMTPT